MSEITWTAEELAEFDRLVEMASSQRQMERLHARLNMPKFIAKHGKEKCDAMWAHLEGERK
jgi:hypothetical protein